MMGPRFRQGSCRLCLWESNSLWDIFGELAERRNFARKIQACVNIIVSKDDGLSSLICPNCIYKIELFYDFQTSCKRSDDLQKRYNGVEDAGCGDCDAAEDGLPGTALHCAVSNSHKDAQGPVETIDIKEEPIDDDDGDEAAVEGVDDEQFEDAEVEIEVVAVAQDRTAEGTTATEQQQQQQKEKGRGEEVVSGNGSCLQLTPPRSPSVASEATYSASESGSSTERNSPEQQQQEGEERAEGRCSDLSREGGGSICRYCAKWHPDPQTCQEHERSCPRRSGADGHQQQQQQQEEVEEETAAAVPLRPPPPPGKYSNRCRFCTKWFQKTSVCRVHERECAPLHGYAAPELASGRGSGKRCRSCSALFLSKAGRGIHEYHCFRRERQIQSGELPPVAPGAAEPQSQSTALRRLPPTPKYCNQCRFCRRYFPRVPLRRLHEAQCGPRFGYRPSTTTPQTVSSPPCEGAGERQCSYCGKRFKTLAGRNGHEHYCRRRPLPTRHNLAANQCRYCHARYLSRSHRLSHELSCAEASGWLDGPKADAALQAGGRDAVKCRYCGKGHLKWRSLLTHEFHCRRKVPPRGEAGPQLAAEAGPQVTAEANTQVAAEADTQDATEAAVEVVEPSAPEVAEAPAPPGDTGSSGDNDKDESFSPSGSTASGDKRQGSLNRCNRCHKWCKTKHGRKLHEEYCSRNFHMTIAGRWYKCSYCSRVFLRRCSCVMHERHCPQATDRTCDSGTVGRAAVSVVPERREQQLGSTACDGAQLRGGSTDEREVIFPGLSQSERKRKNVDSPSCLPSAANAKEMDVCMCRYCDKAFKYRECLRTHEVKCGAIAAYQYSTPPHRSPTFFTCPLCRKAFKFRRKLHNHWKVCRARTSVVAEAGELNREAKSTRAIPERLEGSGGGGGVTAPFGTESSPGEDRVEWRGWPSGYSQTVVDSLTDDDSVTSVADSSGLSCKLCHKDFCSRVLLELHTLNECVYQRIRNDHAYAQCESPSVDESTLMRMARVELQRLLLCSCCGRIFGDRQELSDHELAERQRHGQTSTEARDQSSGDLEATHVQKRIKLAEATRELGLHLEGRGQQESNCRVEQLTANYQAVPATDKLEDADSRRESNKNCLLQEILLDGDCQQLLQNLTSEEKMKQVYSEDSDQKLEIKKEEIDFQHLESQHLESANGERGLSNKSVLQTLVKNNSDCKQEHLKDDPGKKVPSTNSGLEQESQRVIVHPQHQECISDDDKWQLQNKMPNLAHLLQQQ
ncbi:uncharacterized protein LOC126458173 [Schistocerca serialis cubense]|uniref:uncharacterized protein LOC126458173 n=1 Tax=Schistocerca serialis cubense TaxID=2023355 RepID=UPI00214E3DCD|nr:uncharacterized protein LOC126458173 [Schistocerca serialis cubense]